ncbi:MAG: cytochrome c family protein [Steroidobacteraceae bacterium]|nr:cytochrome c family protein [Steroidobacteraceae bacterium]
MITRATLIGTSFAVVLLAAGCGSPTSSTDKPSPELTSPSPEATQSQTVIAAPAEPEQVADVPAAADVPAPVVAPVEAPATAPQAPAASPAAPPPAASAAANTAKAPPAAAPTPAPTPASAPVAAAAPTPKPEAPMPAPAVQASPPPAAPAATSAIADPGGTVAVAATKPGLVRIGAEACGDCHDVQFESWAGGAHAKRKPPLDCEHCHGPGSEYKSKAVMKDPVKAEAAGLVVPDKAFCAKCHKKGVDDAFMEKAHAHEG